MQLVIILAAMALGLSYGHTFTGFDFLPAICLFAGLFLVMPTLFNINVSDIGLIKKHKKLLAKMLFVNFLILPFIAIVIGLMTQDFGIASGIFLLSVLAGGGMVMQWIKRSNANTKVGFIFLMIDLLLLSLSFYMFKLFGVLFAPYYNTLYSAGIENVELKGAFVLLIVIPFIVSRILLRFVPQLPIVITRYQRSISNGAIFLIVFYLFALKNSQVLFNIEGVLLLSSFLGTLLFYGATTLIATLFFNTRSPEERAAFWHTITRYITLGLVISTYTIQSHSATLLLPIIMAYLIQLPLSLYFINRFLTK